MTTAYPLSWPIGWPRTANHMQEDSRNRWGRGEGRKRRPWTFGEARDELFTELSRFGAESVILSSNFRLTQNDMPSKNYGVPLDQGIAIYFRLRGRPMVMAQDGHTRAEENMRSLALVLKYLRGVEALGGGTMMEKTFEGFAALPAPGPETKRSWREVLGFPASSSPDRIGIDLAYRSKAKAAHPDAPGGSHDAMAELNRAKDEALREIG